MVWCYTLLYLLAKTSLENLLALAKQQESRCSMQCSYPLCKQTLIPTQVLKIPWVKLPEYIQQLHCFTRGLQEVCNTHLGLNISNLGLFRTRGSSS